ncbi:MAG: tetratricopeptide repeat protein [Anaerolineales bacterium]
MYLSGSHLRLRNRGRHSSPRRIIFFLVLILGGLLLVSLQQQGQVQPLFVPTPTATRNPHSYADEAEAQFAAGHLKEAIQAYKRAIEVDALNVDYWVALARIQIYDGQYEEALKTAEEARLLAPNSAKTRAIHAWALDWNAEELQQGCSCTTLAQAEATAVEAVALDPNYAPAHAYYSEILNDQGKWDQGSTQAQLALQLDPNSLDARRAMGLANEVVGNYQGAIERYKSALEVNPNLMILYIKLGLMYRDGLRNHEQAIFYFSKANALDPYNVEPYLYLSRTKYQIDELGAAQQYLEQALTYAPNNPDIYGRLGLILFKRRNYEGAEPALKLAIFGGTPTDSEGNPVRDGSGQEIVIKGMELNTRSLEYYYTLGNLQAYNGKCGPASDEAPALLEQAIQFAPDNQTVVGSYTESMQICENIRLGITPAPEDTAVGATPTPTP